MDHPIPDEETHRWSLAKRILFRFASLYFLLYVLPFPFDRISKLITQSISAFFKDVSLDGRLWTWIDDRFLDYRTLWESSTTWLGEQSWVDVEVVHQLTGSGDTAHDYLKVAIIFVYAAFLTLIWSVLFRRAPHYRSRARWLHLACRWYLCFVLLDYGVVKQFGGQFRYPDLWRMTNTIGETSPMGLVWTFMGFSKPYEMFTGFGECLGGLLLLWRRTSLLGCFVTIAVMSNVAALNWLFDVPVKLFSTHLLLMAIFLMIPDIRRLLRFFVQNKTVESASIALTSRRAFNSWLIRIGTAVISLHLVVTCFAHIEFMKEYPQVRSELFGVWTLERTVRDGEEVPKNITLGEQWRKLGVDNQSRAWFESQSGLQTWVHFEFETDGDINSNVGTVMIAPLKPKEVDQPREAWTYEVLENIVPSENGQPAKTKRRLTLKGLWEGSNLEMELLYKPFELERGFHLIQERPYNR